MTEVSKAMVLGADNTDEDDPHVGFVVAGNADACALALPEVDWDALGNPTEVVVTVTVPAPS